MTASAKPVGPMDHRSAICGVLNGMLKKAGDNGRNRDVIALDVSQRLGFSVSKHMIDGYTAVSRKAFNLPFYAAPAFEAACGDDALAQWLASVRGGAVIAGDDAPALAYWRLAAERERIDAQMRALCSD